MSDVYETFTKKTLRFGLFKKKPPTNNGFDEVFKDHFIFINTQKIQSL